MITYQDNQHIREGSVKKSHLFGITIPHTHIPKEHAYEGLYDFCQELVVSEERHHNIGVHHHIFMNTIDSYHVVEVEEMIKNLYGINEWGEDIEMVSQTELQEQQQLQQQQLMEYENGNDDDDDDDDNDDNNENDNINEFGIYKNNYLINNRIYPRFTLHVVTVKSPKYWIKYITKSDMSPLTKNITFDRLSFYTYFMNWAQSTTHYNLADPFVLEHANRYKFIEAAHREVRAKMNQRPLMPMREYTINPQSTEQLMPWQNEIVLWWNDWIKNGWHERKKQLYLWGPSSTGKTSFIRRLLKECVRSDDLSATSNRFYQDQIFMPTPNTHQFAFQSFNDQRHTLVLIDEFDIVQYDTSTLKKMFAGESFMADVKGSTARRLELHMPMILISNLEPPRLISNQPQTVKYQGFVERFVVVNTLQ